MRRSPARRRLALAPALLALLSATGGTPQPPGAPAPAQPTHLTEKVTVSLVLVEVVAVDRSGQHVRGLEKEDFVVREDGQVVPIASFDEIDLPGGGAPGPAPAPEETAPPPASPPAETAESREPAVPRPPPGPAESARRRDSQRRFVLVFDGYNNTSALRLVQARRAAKEFVRTKLGPGDSAAVYEMSPFLRPITFFTSDPGGLDEAIDQIRYFGGQSLGEQISDNALRTGLLGSAAAIESRMLSQAQFGASQAAAERREFYIALASLAEALEAVPGRKTLVFFSGGFSVGRAREEASNLGFTLEFRNAIRALERARVTIYAMDIGEEKAMGDVTTGVSDRTIADQLGLPADFLERMGGGMEAGGDSVSAQNQILAVLSNESGGRYLGGRDYPRSFRAVDDDTRHFYLLGWRPPEMEGTAGDAASPRRDRYRPIEISTTRKGVRIISRRGRYNWTQEPAPAAAAIPAAAPRPAVEFAPDPVRAHTLRCVPVPFAGRDGKGLLSLPLLLEGAVDPVPAAGGGVSLDLSTRVVARAGGVEIERKEHSFRISGKPEMRKALGAGLRLTEAIELAPGRYDVEVWVRLNGLDVEATWRGAASVPEFPPGALRISGLMVSGEASALPPLVADVFTAANTGDGGGEPAAPDPFRLANGWRVAGDSSASIDRSKPVTLFFRLYRPATDPATGAPRNLSLDYVLTPAGGGAGFLPPAQTAYFKKADEEGAFDVVVRLDLGEVPPGPYRLRVEARDPSTAGGSHQERAIEVAAPSKPLDSSK